MENWWQRKNLATTPEDLKKIIKYDFDKPDDYNEVYPGIYLGNERSARNIATLRHLGVTHVVNAAQRLELDQQVNTENTAFYEKIGIQYLGFDTFDTDGFSIYPFFEECNVFMKEALDEGGRVLVNCKFGLSRSATMVLAFLMMVKGMSARKATEIVGTARAINPNYGFLHQICVLDEELSSAPPP